MHPSLHLPKARQQQGGSANGLVVLIADDEPAIRGLAGQVLRREGYEVLEAQDGIEALEQASRRQGPIHLLLTDWCMPRLGGAGLVRVLSDSRPDTAILIMSGHFDSEPPPHSNLLPKPFSPQDLVKMVGHVLRRPLPRDRARAHNRPFA